MTIFDNNQTQEAVASTNNFATNTNANPTLREHVALSMQSYLKQMNGQPLNEVYDLVLTQVEEPLLRAIMEHTRNNQTKAAQVLGLNRGTLRKKLKRYNLL